ncbi:hypothetical protein [Streptosporangium sp. NPDC000396]|uniref:hypothetical protein n=1 Tax=Streptosporangium sp. NPDC000396 TaxID=3366185 RepID=UPI003691C5C5
MSKQTTFTLTLLLGLSVVVPGSAGYLSARMDAVEQAHRELVALEIRLREERLTVPDEQARQTETIAVPAPALCGAPLQPRPRKAPMPAALIPVPVEAVPTGPPQAEAMPVPPAAAEFGEKGLGEQRRPSERKRRHRERQEEVIISERSTAGENAWPRRSPRRAPGVSAAPGRSQVEALTN